MQEVFGVVFGVVVVECKRAGAAGDRRKCRLLNAERRQKASWARLTQSEGARNSAEEGPACSEIGTPLLAGKH